MLKWLQLLLAFVFSVTVVILFFGNISRFSYTMYFFTSQIQFPFFLIFIMVSSFLGGFFFRAAIGGFLSSNKGYDEELDL